MQVGGSDELGAIGPNQVQAGDNEGLGVVSPEQMQVGVGAVRGWGVVGPRSSEDSLRDVHFEDSEEERALNADDGFMHDGVDQAEVELNEKKRGRGSGQNGGTQRQNIGETSGVQNVRINVGDFAPPDLENMHTMEEEYYNEELLNGVEYSDGEAYDLCYRQLTTPISGEQLWPKIGGELILLPIYKSSAGRPKKLHRRNPDEPQNPTKLKRGGTTTRCIGCQKLCHNSRSCTTPPMNPPTEPEVATQQSQ
ncbi:hypothetical protein SESBI_45910 [Sesbania bispinosa]|nr:hypothetical protein SESBI_45910 [Sesbania bispinosa]